MVEFGNLDAMFYRLRQNASKSIPYISSVRHPSVDEDEVVILLDRACELTLRAVDATVGGKVEYTFRLVRD